MEGAQWTVKYSTCIDVLRRNKNSQEHWPQFFMCWVNVFKETNVILLLNPNKYMSVFLPVSVMWEFLG